MSWGYMKLMKHYANNSLIISDVVSPFLLAEFTPGVPQTPPDLLFSTGQTQSKRMMDVVAGAVIFQQPRVWSGQEPYFSSWYLTNQCSSRRSWWVLRKIWTYPTFWNLFSKWFQTYLIFCTWIHCKCNYKCNRKVTVVYYMQLSLSLIRSCNSQPSSVIFRTFIQ